MNTYIFARIALFIIYFWFGLLKVLGSSPASPLVEKLQSATIPFIGFEQFIVLFGLFEMALGLLFLFPKWIKFASIMFVLHMLTTTLPLFILYDTTWQKFMAPTLEGQYIIKNLALIGLVYFLSKERKVSI